MSRKFGISVPDDLYWRIEEAKGTTTRSAFIAEILKQNLDEGIRAMRLDEMKVLVRQMVKDYLEEEA